MFLSGHIRPTVRLRAGREGLNHKTDKHVLDELSGSVPAAIQQTATIFKKALPGLIPSIHSSIHPPPPPAPAGPALSGHESAAVRFVLTNRARYWPGLEIEPFDLSSVALIPPQVFYLCEWTIEICANRLLKTPLISAGYYVSLWAGVQVQMVPEMCC